MRKPPFHAPGKALARALLAEGEEGLQVLLHELVEHRRGRSAAAVQTHRGTCLLPPGTGGIAPIRDCLHSPEPIPACRHVGSALSPGRVDSIPSVCMPSPSALGRQNRLGATSAFAAERTFSRAQGSGKARVDTPLPAQGSRNARSLVRVDARGKTCPVVLVMGVGDFRVIIHRLSVRASESLRVDSGSRTKNRHS
jgi:hypothetical protein